ncbi:hypothetical protein VC83_00569 [Pseudogymnoascus destructans]|uniref:Uncharacterized protein n=2 Tax=Pseudogymnoascus destructans TaxID=655981 RepID=L8GBT5_PSED2|nr:uncharacterized protein VC83_00569 [Pseudogymnoascus destructans]ELR09511.1 hypothetical protein GMDG_00693 [Pseudogymnoascus destructans 20631-21]OAF63339.1 hypothetical protein VC83_00569 [Pseudogymnoascus destructans]
MLDFIASTSESKEVGYLIVVGYGVVYISKAICTSFDLHQLDRFATTLRGCLLNCTAGILYNVVFGVQPCGSAPDDSTLVWLEATEERVARIRRIELFLKAETKRDNRMIMELGREVIDPSFGHAIQRQTEDAIVIRDLS